MSAVRSPAAEYGRFLAWSAAVGLALVLLGYAPTRRLGGEGAPAAMLAGCAVGVIASAVGGLPVYFARRSGRSSRAPLEPALFAMAARLAAVVALGLSVGLSGWFESRPLLIWIALGYVAQLALETRYATRGL